MRQIPIGWGTDGLGGAMKAAKRNCFGSISSRGRARWLAALLGLAGGSLLSGTVQAQQAAAGRLVPSSLRPAPGVGASISLPGGVAQKEPADAKSRYVFVRRIKVVNGFFQLEQRTAALTAAVEGRRVTLDDIYKLAGAINQAYGDEGFPLVRVVIPRQQFESGFIEIDIIDGFIKSVDVNKLPSTVRNRVAELMAPLIGLRHVTLSEIQKQLLLVGEIPGIKVHFTALEDEQGSTTITMDGTQRIVTGSVGFDNRLPSTLGTYELTTALQLNSPFGLGEQAYIAAASGYNLQQVFDGNSPWETIGGGFDLPIGDSGFNINPSYVWAHTLEEAFYGGPLEDDLFDRFSLKANYPLLLTLKQTLRIQGEYDYINEQETPYGSEFLLNQDRYSALRFGVNYGYLFSSKTKIQVDGIFSQGIGGRSPTGDETPLSTPGASSEFSKFYGDGRLLQPLPDNFSALLIGRAQTSFGAPLMLAEQFDLDGADALSGFSAATLPVDQGGTIRGELARQFDIKLGPDTANLYPYVFGSGGRGNLETQYLNGIQVIDAASVGVGMRNNLGFSPTSVTTSVNAELAKDFSNIPYRHDGYRGNISVAVRF